MQILSHSELQSMQDSTSKMTLIDVLSEENFEEAHIPGAINIPIHSEDFVHQVQNKVSDKNENIVVYCASFDCNAAAEAAQMLEDAGYTRVFDFQGGIREWRNARLPLARVETPA